MCYLALLKEQSVLLEEQQKQALVFYLYVQYRLVVGELVGV